MAEENRSENSTNTFLSKVRERQTDGHKWS